MKTALITGANKGLGFQSAKDLGKLDYHILLGSRDVIKGKEALKELEKLSISCELLEIDVSNINSINSAFESLKNKDVHVLVNNAGIFPDRDSRFVDADSEVFHQTINTNLFGAIELTKLIIPKMEKQGYGRIVMVSSGLGQMEGMGAGYAAYRISKTAMNAATQIFAAEMKHPNVTINSVCPGWCRTDMGGSGADRTIEHGAETIVWLASLNNTSNGKFFRDKEEIPW
jgi:NAD(P)-dependent dehydrogenase (short-subunit alcohol dehydrogenase family)